MKAIIYNRYGGPEELVPSDIPPPPLKATEVLVKVCATSINSWDWDLLRGKPFIVRLISGGIMKPGLKVLGCDLAGIVESVGSSVTSFNPGDEVFGDVSGGTWGGLAEYARAPEELLAKIPPKMSFEDAAALPQAGVLAVQALQMNGPVQKGSKVLINGAGGGVGTFALQIAKNFGALVTAVDTEEKLMMLTTLGAYKVINYRTHDFTKGGEQYDLILDMVSHRSVFDYHRVLRPGGYCVIIGGSLGRIALAALINPLVSKVKKKNVKILAHRPNRKDLETLAELFISGKIRTVIDQIYPLSKSKEAFQHFGTGNVKGKLVIFHEGVPLRN